MHDSSPEDSEEFQLLDFKPLTLIDHNRSFCAINVELNRIDLPGDNNWFQNGAHMAAHVVNSVEIPGLALT